MDQEYEKMRGELSALIAAIDNARANGLEYEFLEFFLRDYKTSGSIPEAIWYADCEWDL